MNSNADISQLAVERDDSRNGSSREFPAGRRHIFSRYLLPATIILGFVILVAWAARDVLLPAQKVTVMPVLARETSNANIGSPLFTAAGWVEPRPSPVLATSLATGTIEKLLVVEGQAVDAGDPIAKLIDADARIQLREAEADVDYREAELEAARAQLTSAQTNLDHPTHLEAALAEAQSDLVEAEIRIANLPYEIKAAESQVSLTQKSLDQKTRAGQVVPGSVLQQARADWEKATATYNRLVVLDPLLINRVQALRRQCDAIDRQLKLKSAEVLAVAEATTGVEGSIAQLTRAKIAVESAKLQLDRMTVPAPIAGRILNVIARQGTRVTGMPGDSQFGSSIVATMYDPKQLQIRADVRLEDLPLVAEGQTVAIETASLENPISGKVLQVTSAADIQKNTLEVKVAVIDPPELLKPEMLVQLTFLGHETPGNSESRGKKQRPFVPELLINSNEEGEFIWIADQDARVAKHTTIKTAGRSDENGLIEITEGITMSSKLIVSGREGLQDGDRIEITGEDTTFGLSNRGSNQRQE